MFDANKTGSITTKELGSVLRGMGQAPSESELKDMVDEVDEDGTWYQTHCYNGLYVVSSIDLPFKKSANIAYSVSVCGKTSANPVSDY